jgi:hypothetical protein
MPRDDDPRENDFLTREQFDLLLSNILPAEVSAAACP